MLLKSCDLDKNGPKQSSSHPRIRIGHDSKILNPYYGSWSPFNNLLLNSCSLISIIYLFIFLELFIYRYQAPSTHITSPLMFLTLRNNGVNIVRSKWHILYVYNYINFLKSDSFFLLILPRIIGWKLCINIFDELDIMYVSLVVFCVLMMLETTLLV